MLQGPVQMTIQSFPVERTDARSRLFSEQEAFWHIPLHEISAVVDVAVTKGQLQRQWLYYVDCHMMTVDVNEHQQLM